MNFDSFRLDADFPGGNILLERIEDDAVSLRQDLRDTEGDWFYWAFRVRGAAGRRLTFHFTGSDVIAARGPAISLDGGQSWQWLGERCVLRKGEQFTNEQGANWTVAFFYDFPQHLGEILFSFCPLYTQSRLDAFLAEKNHDLKLRREVLCRSRSGREVGVLRLGNPTAQFHLLLLCRHHACEAMASFCLEGFLEAALDEDELGQWLRENLNITAIPFMDTDGVEAGDQGKNRKPYDHNRDYGGEPADSIYPEVKALREQMPEWLSGHQTNIILDLHCPHIRGERNEVVYFVGTPNEKAWQRVNDFSRILEAQCSGPLPFRTVDNLPFGKEWNILSSSEIGKSACAFWGCDQAGVLFSTSLEIPYAAARNIEVTPAGSKALGRDLATALRSYLAPVV